MAELAADAHPALHKLWAANLCVYVCLPALTDWLVTRHTGAINVMRDAKTYFEPLYALLGQQLYDPNKLSNK